ncbi:MAG TPA: IS1634 family transposase [Thermodesulfovibrionales bacterium]|nr:IS1634 family transposase [Thermodesulfovibrionales bacterium]
MPLLNAFFGFMNCCRIRRPRADIFNSDTASCSGAVLILFFDITSTYFEGAMQGSAQAKRGYSRDGRPDCVQVTVGLVASKEGLPLALEVFDGNRTDVTTVEEMVEMMEKKYGAAEVVWVMDRGMVSEKNLAFMRREALISMRLPYCYPSFILSQHIRGMVI